MVRLSGIQMELKNQTIWHLTSYRPFKYQTSLVFRSPLYSDSHFTRLVLNRFSDAVQKLPFDDFPPSECRTIIFDFCRWRRTTDERKNPSFKRRWCKSKTSKPSSSRSVGGRNERRSEFVEKKQKLKSSWGRKTPGSRPSQLLSWRKRRKRVRYGGWPGRSQEFCLGQKYQKMSSSTP